MGVPSSFMLRRGHRAANQGRASNQEARAPMAPGAQKSKSSILIAPGAPPSSSKGLPPRASSSSNPNESGAGVGIATRASRGKMERTVEATSFSLDASLDLSPAYPSWSYASAQRNAISLAALLASWLPS
mmetsp:Transcript_31437/g.96145  ORF Transcript_31437/g.96145 Transcript_31437/m.96145 type:complete len:130 (-) Transcript_31437:2005-2394(-)